MHNAAQLAAHFSLHRDDVAAVAQRDDRLLGDALHERRAQDVLEALIQAIVQRPHLAPDAAERRTRLVRDLAALVDAAVDVLDQPRKRLNHRYNVRQQRQRLVQPSDGALQDARAGEGLRDLQQVGRIQ